jgi:hypothetical protein
MASFPQIGGSWSGKASWHREMYGIKGIALTLDLKRTNALNIVLAQDALAVIAPPLMHFRSRPVLFVYAPSAPAPVHPPPA